MKTFALSLLFTSLVFATCPESGDGIHYAFAPLRPAGSPPGILKVFYKTLDTFDPKKPTLLVINGGPGGDHSIINILKDTPLASALNVVGFDHRGVGCTHSMERIPDSYEPNEFGMSRAASDIEAIRKDLLGDNGKWFVYGVSYGTMLGQNYAIRYPGSILGLILDSAFHDVDALQTARQQFLNLFVLDNTTTKTLFHKFTAKYPDLEISFLRRIRGAAYGYSGRTTVIPNVLKALVDAPSEAEAKKLLTNHNDIEPPFTGMFRRILCEEIWDYPAATESANQYFFWFAPSECASFTKHRNPMKLADALKKLNVRTFIWGGKYDPVTPIQAMREMKGLIPNSILWENPEAGHGLISEKSSCAIPLAMMFMSGASNGDLEAKAKSAECQSPPTKSERAMKPYWRYSESRVPLL